MTGTSLDASEVTFTVERPTLSVCMIVKNEERFLAQCLESVKDVADEIIVVDTGSTDRTVEIARRYTDRVYFHPWNDSFSEARNYSLSYATGDWILQIDADEELERKDVPLLLATLRHVHPMEEVEAIGVPLLSTLPAGRLARHYFPRLFRRGKAHFEGIVHNQLIYEGKHLVSEVRLWHYGYNLSRAELERKWKRTEELLLRQLAEDPEDTFAWMNLLRVYRNSGRHEQVIAKGTWVLGLSDTRRLHRHGVACDVAISCRTLGRYAQGEAVLLEELKRIPDSLDLVMELALTYFSQEEKTDLAIRQFKRFLALKREDKADPKPTELVYDHYSSEGMAWNHLGGCYVRRGEPDKAIDAFQRAIELCPEDGDPYANLALCYARGGSLAQAEAALQRAITAGAANAAVWRRLGDVYRAQGQPGAAEDAYRRARQSEDENAAPQSALVTPTQPASLGATPPSLRWKALASGVAPLTDAIRSARLKAAQGAYQEAIALLEQHLQLYPADLDALADVATCYAHLQQYSAALEGYRCVLSASPGDAVVRHNLALLLEGTPLAASPA